ncbi:hypothetical protein BJ508DRAFT_333626 [Ascobolus immersus RN42]|uniref:Uncharacterized protein n=1 Tax=Ascobolus immersus RN42 TaxID=1160509 RepID=A0A3N4HLS6_ASCIM|nr:hypothetical protein BJ508DRAFT_333626 [Ascobolus immersus RN42]
MIEISVHVPSIRRLRHPQVPEAMQRTNLTDKDVPDPAHLLHMSKVQELEATWNTIQSIANEEKGGPSTSTNHNYSNTHGNLTSSIKYGRSLETDLAETPAKLEMFRKDFSVAVTRLTSVLSDAERNPQPFQAMVWAESKALKAVIDASKPQKRWDYYDEDEDSEKEPEPNRVGAVEHGVVKWLEKVPVAVEVEVRNGDSDSVRRGNNT